MCDPMVRNEDSLFATAQAEKQGVSRKAAKNGKIRNTALFISFFASLRLCAKIAFV
jgi:hypothetical protein